MKELKVNAYGMELTTKWNKDKIEQFIVFENTIMDMHKAILNLQEDHIKKALVDLGWTPPKKEKDE